MGLSYNFSFAPLGNGVLTPEICMDHCRAALCNVDTNLKFLPLFAFALLLFFDFYRKNSKEKWYSRKIEVGLFGTVLSLLLVYGLSLFFHDWFTVFE